MTENQEKEVFLLLNTIVTEVRSVKSEVKEIRQTLDEHSQILGEHSQILGEHSQILNKHSQILNEHSQILKRLDAKTDTIAETVMNHESRITKAEKDIEELRGGIH